MKYLITKQNQVKIFPDVLSHSKMADPKKIKSAGYFRVSKNKQEIETYGKSHSTGIKSKKEDARLVTKQLYHIRKGVR